MNPDKMLKLTCALVLSAAAGLSQVPQTDSPRTTTTRFDGFPGLPAVRSALLELRLVDRGNPASLELRGGVPGSLATVAVAGSIAEAPTLERGVFDAGGRFALAVGLGRFPASQFVCQGFGAVLDLEGRWTMQASNGLHVDLTDPALVPPTGPVAGITADFSLLRIELDEPGHGRQAVDRVLAKDFVGALGTALNSHGDALQAKIGGKVMICVPSTPVQVGGSVAYSAKIVRDGSDYLVGIGAEVAVLCGVKATKDIGVEGGVTLGSDQIYRFGSPAEVARGLFGIALQQALPGALEVLRGENLAKVRELRRHIAGLVAALERVRARRTFRGPALEWALDNALRTIIVVHGRLSRIGDALDRAAGWLVDEAQFVRNHTDGAELRCSITSEASLKIGDKKCGDRIGAEFGGKVNGGYQLTVRMFQGYGEEPQRVEVLAAHAIGGSFAAGLKIGSLVDKNEKAFGRGFEISQKTTRGVRTVFARQGDGFGTPQVAIVIKREFGLLGFGRETTIEFDAAELGAVGSAALTALFDGQPEQALSPLMSITAHVSVQDKITMALKPEFGVENTALTAKVAAEFAWSDCGPQRQADLSLATVLERLLDVERTAAQVQELVQQVLALPQLQ